MCIRKVYNILNGIWKVGILASIFRCAIHLPGIKQHVNKEKADNGKMFWDKYKKVRTNTIKVLPEVGMSKEEITNRMVTAEKFGRKCYEEGKHSGAVYHGGAEHWKFISDCMATQIVSNTLHMDQFLPVV